MGRGLLNLQLKAWVDWDLCERKNGNLEWEDDNRFPAGRGYHYKD